MAARQGGRAHGRMLSGNRHRTAAGHLSLHRQQSGRSRAGQAPHRRRDDRPSAAAARRRSAHRRRPRTGAPDRRIRPSRRARPPPPRAAGEADRRDCAAHRLGARGRYRRRRRPDDALRRIDAWLCDLKDLAVKDGLHIYGRAPAGTRRSAMVGERRCRTRGAARGARRPPRRARPGRRADARAARRAADRPQSLHRRSAHAADADRDGPRPARRRRNFARASASPRRAAARRRDRSLGQRHLAHRRRGDRARFGADGLPADLGSCQRPRDRRRGSADRRDRARAGRRHLAHLRTVPRSFPGADRAHRCRRAGGRRARRSRR